MIETHSYANVCSTLARRFSQDYDGRTVNLTGLIFANPETPFAKREVLPHVDYWHHRSDNVTDFFCAGYGAYGPENDPHDRFPVPGVRHEPWWFSSSRFAAFVNEIEQMTDWVHQGGAEIMLTTARFDRETEKARLDFRSAVIIDLEQASRDEAFRDFSQLLQSVFGFAQDINEDTADPAFAYSDSRGQFMLRRSLKDILIGLLPKTLQKNVLRAVHYAARDVRPRLQDGAL